MQYIIRTSVFQRRVGTEEQAPESVTLRAGALTADFTAGGLRAVRYEGHEVLRAIAYLVRDPDWGTYNPEIRDCSIHQTVDAFRVTYRGRCIAANQILDYQARITGDDRGHLLFDVVAESPTSFLTARCGFAVLHPIEGVAGQPATVEHVDGSEEQTTFPDLISPVQPFKDIRAIRHQVAPGITARCCLNGDTFEMEDQRNWSDASYKTYVRPLALPWPYIIERGVANRQSVEVKIVQNQGPIQKLPSREASRENAPVTATIGDPEGTFPGIGVSIHPDLIPQALAHPALINGLRPQLLLFHFDPTAGHGHSHLRGFTNIAKCVAPSDKMESVLELVVPGERDVREELFGLASILAEAKLGVTGILVSPAADLKSTSPSASRPLCPPLAEIYQAAREAFPGIAVGGGTLNYFTELNRKRPPVELLDFVSHCTCPIVHAADDLSVMENLEALPHIVRSARSIIGKNKPYRIGPSTIGMRHNPYGARVKENPTNGRVPMTDCDPRQTSLFAAAWMIGYVAATAEAHLETLTIGSLTGPLGLAYGSASGEVQVYPVFHTARGLADLGGHLRYQARSSRPDTVAAVAGVDRQGTDVAWLANLTGRNQTVTLAGDREVRSILMLDEESFIEPRVEVWRGNTTKTVPSVELLPYAVVCMRF